MGAPNRIICTQMERRSLPKWSDACRSAIPLAALAGPRKHGRPRYMVSVVDFRRLGRGDIVGAAGGLFLFISMFLPWFSVDALPPESENLCGQGVESCSGFDTFSLFSSLIIPGMDLLLVAAAVAPWILVWIVVRGHQLSWPPGEVTMIVGAIASTLILYNGVIDRVGDTREFVSLDIGWYLGLLGALMIVAGGAISQISRGGVRRKPPGTF
jgi:hypothetical protein